MNPTLLNVLKIAGIVDGVTLAAVTALGQAVPAWAPTTTVIVEVLGTIGTLLAGLHTMSATRSAEVPKP
jgi:hypothetical protein